MTLRCPVRPTPTVHLTHLDGGDVEVLVEADRRRVSSVDSVQLRLHAFHVLYKELHLQAKVKMYLSCLPDE